MDWFQCGSEVHLRAYQGLLPCMLSCAVSRTKTLLLQRHSVSPPKIKRASPLVASPTGIKGFWLVFWRVRNDFKHFKGWRAQRKLLSRRCSVSAPGELGCIEFLPWWQKPRAATTPRSHFWCWQLCLFSRGQWDTCTFPSSSWADFQVFCTSHSFLSTSPNRHHCHQGGLMLKHFCFRTSRHRGKQRANLVFAQKSCHDGCASGLLCSHSHPSVCQAHLLNESLCSPPACRRARRWCLAPERAPVPRAATSSIQVKMGCTQESAWAPRPKWQHLWGRIPGVPWLWRDLVWRKLDPGSPQTSARSFLCGASGRSGSESAGKDHSSETVFEPWWQRWFSTSKRGFAKASSSSTMQEKCR